MWSGGAGETEVHAFVIQVTFDTGDGRGMSAQFYTVQLFNLDAAEKTWWAGSVAEACRLGGADGDIEAAQKVGRVVILIRPGRHRLQATALCTPPRTHHAQ